MEAIKQSLRWSRLEKRLWFLSVVVVTIGFLWSGTFMPLLYGTSLVGVTSLIFLARGDVIGQYLMVLFSLLYGVISYQQTYYGEIITYVGMTAPMAVLSAVVWHKHPFAEKGERAKVTVGQMKGSRWLLGVVLSIVVTAVFYLLLQALGNAALGWSTLSIATSFFAAYLTFCRSEYYAVAYAVNDLVLIVLWILAALVDPVALPMIACFLMFFCNDLYGFIAWRKRKQQQQTVKNGDDQQKNVETNETFDI